jgi:hypothetical protein
MLNSIRAEVRCSNGQMNRTSQRRRGNWSAVPHSFGGRRLCSLVICGRWTTRIQDIASVLTGKTYYGYES